ncbi:lipoprotein signal peptidase [bacterium BMS3Abin04]|nr:lipoprotein signal peptidase [bacterium BMS3Abin04]
MKVLYLSLLVVISDQVSKLVVKGISIPFLNINLHGMSYGSSFDVIGSFFKIWFVENPGMAFGIDVGNGSKLFLSLFSLLASILIIFYLYKVRNQNFWLRVALALILGGAIGNLIDRTFYGIIFGYAPIFYGKVVDFFSVDFFDFSIFGHTYERWPIFNVADSAVTIGVIILLFIKKQPDENEYSEELEINNNSKAIEVINDLENDNNNTKEIKV